MVKIFVPTKPYNFYKEIVSFLQNFHKEMHFGVLFWDFKLKNFPGRLLFEFLINQPKHLSNFVCLRKKVVKLQSLFTKLNEGHGLVSLNFQPWVFLDV